MKNIIVGTAGHIDHGKTALVRALTGIETDRLEEEIRRGITIDLGFAWLELEGDLLLGFVDVPGHERFVRNMLAGAGGIDLVILVVAADESIKPQTREHFDICRLLGVRRGLVAITKADLVDEEMLELVKLEVEELVAGSFLEGCPMVPVSALTGEGIDRLREQLSRVARTAEGRPRTQPARLPVDRSFSLKGFGTVVTGTLLAGEIRRDTELELHPGRRVVRVRGIQVHGKPAERAEAGQRTALNLAGVEAGEIQRGMVLAEKGCFQATRVLDCRLELLATAPALRHRTPLHFHTGAAETIAELRLLDGAAQVAANESVYARLLLKDPVLTLPGDRFIVRRFSPVVTVGGGVVVDIEGPRYSAKLPAGRRLEMLERADAARRMELLVEESPGGLSIAELTRRTGLGAQQLLVEAPVEKVILVGDPPQWAFSRRRWEDWTATVEQAVAAYHQENPLREGMPRHELRQLLPAACPPVTPEEIVRRSPVLEAVGDVVRWRSHRVALTEQEEALLARLEDYFRRAGWEAPPLEQAIAAIGDSPSRTRTLLHMLLRRGRLVRIHEDLVLHQEAVGRLKAVLGAHRGERFSVATFKEWTGLTRKYAIPILEFLDREKVTRRTGDERVVL